MTPSQNIPLKVPKEQTLRALIEDMNAAQAVAVAILPRFGVEITLENQQFQVQVSELATGHDIRLAREISGGLIEALTRLNEKIDEFLASNPTPEQLTGGPVNDRNPS